MQDGEPGLLEVLAKVHPPAISRKTRAIRRLPELARAYKEAGECGSVGAGGCRWVLVSADP